MAIRKPHRHPVSSTDDCHDAVYDKDGDGYIDTAELHACRQQRQECHLRTYDVNGDGYLDADELHACHQQLLECPLHNYDANRNGYLDADELHACRKPRRGCDLAIYDANHDGYLDVQELANCQRYYDQIVPDPNYYETDKYVRYCQDRYFDLNNDGTVDSAELEKCLQRYGLHRRQNLRYLGKRHYLRGHRARRDDLISEESMASDETDFAESRAEKVQKEMSQDTVEKLDEDFN